MAAVGDEDERHEPEGLSPVAGPGESLVRGAIDGALVAAFLLALRLCLDPRPLDEMGLAFVGLTLGGAVFHAGGSFARRRSGWKRRLAFFGGGVAAAFAAIAASFAMHPAAREALVVSAFGIGLVVGLAQAVASLPLGLVSWRRPLGRAVLVTAYTALLVVLPVFAFAVAGAVRDPAGTRAISNATALLLYGLPLVTLVRRLLASVKLPRRAPTRAAPTASTPRRAAST